MKFNLGDKVVPINEPIGFENGSFENFLELQKGNKFEIFFRKNGYLIIHDECIVPSCGDEKGDDCWSFKEQDLIPYEEKENETMKFEIGMKVTPIKKSEWYEYNSIEEFIEHNKNDCCAIFLKENGYLRVWEVSEETKELELTCGCGSYWSFSFDDVVPYKGKIKEFKLGEPSIILEDTTTGEIVFQSKKLEDYTMEELKQEITRRETSNLENAHRLIKEINEKIQEFNETGFEIGTRDEEGFYTKVSGAEYIDCGEGFFEIMTN